MLDLDHFKDVNDTYGHLAGDVALKEAARRIQDAIRSYDLVAAVPPELVVGGSPGDSTAPAGPPLRDSAFRTDCGITRLVGDPAMLAHYFQIQEGDLNAKAVNDPHAAVAADVAATAAPPHSSAAASPATARRTRFVANIFASLS